MASIIQEDIRRFVRKHLGRKSLELTAGLWWSSLDHRCYIVSWSSGAIQIERR